MCVRIGRGVVLDMPNQNFGEGNFSPHEVGVGITM